MKMNGLSRLALLSMTLLPMGCGSNAVSRLAEIPAPTAPDDLMTVPPEEVPYHLPNQEVLHGWYGSLDMPGDMNCDISPEIFNVGVEGDQLTIANEQSIAERKCDNGAVFKDIKTRVETVYTCEGEDWSEWNAGRTVDVNADLGLTTTKLCPQGKGTLSHYISIGFTASMPGADTASFLGVASIRGANNQGGCKFTSNGATRAMSEDCVYTSLSQMKLDGESGTQFFSAVIAPGSTIDMELGRFVNGAMKAKMNDWAGEISFTKDLMSYKFTKGEEVAEGDVSPMKAMKKAAFGGIFSNRK